MEAVPVALPVKLNDIAGKLVSELKPNLSANARILTDAASEDFKLSTQGWSNINAKVPASVVRPATFDDVSTFVKYATTNKVPFVPRAGGHSIYSSIGAEGVMLDLRLLDKIKVDKNAATVTFQAGVLTQPLLKACWEAGYLVATGNCNTVGAVPVILGGGFNLLEGHVGPASDMLVESKMVLASGEIVTVSERSNPDLFWAVRGAGMFFGIVLECTVKLLPFTLSARGDGQLWTAMIVLDVDSQLEAVLKSFQGLIDRQDPDAFGLIIISSPPPAFQPALMLMLGYLGTADAAKKEYAELLTLPQFFSQVQEVPFWKFGDLAETFCVKGEFKSLDGVPRRDINLDAIRESFAKYREFVAKYPEAANSGVGLEFRGVHPKKHEDTAFGHRDVRYWVEILPWWKDEETTPAAMAFWDEQIEIHRRGIEEKHLGAYNNFGRRDRVELRYPGEGVLGRLRTLKVKYDPTGAFTREFL